MGHAEPVNVADEVCGPDGDHDHQHCSGEIGGSPATESGGLPEEDEDNVEAPHRERCDDFGIEEVGSAERGFLHEDGTKDQADGHAGKSEEEHGVGDALKGIEGRKPVEGSEAGVFAGLELGFEAAFLDEVKDRCEQAESEGCVSRKQCGDVGDEPTGADSLGRKAVAADSQRGYENEEERDGQGEDAQRNGVVEPPGEEEEADNDKAQQRFGFARSDGNPAMGLDEHFYGGDEVEKVGETTEMNAPSAPASALRKARPGRWRSRLSTEQEPSCRTPGWT